MTEGPFSHGDHDPLFHCGAQSNADGDLIPATFTVFPANSDQDEAVGVIIEKIAGTLAELNIEEAEGVITFVPVCNWQVWAEIDLSEEVKMAALVDAITNRTLDGMAIAVETTTAFLKNAWANSH